MQEAVQLKSEGQQQAGTVTTLLGGSVRDSDTQRDACTALHEGKHKCRVPYGSELPDVSSTRWQDLPVIAWPIFPLHESAPVGDKLLLILFAGRLQEIQQAVSGRGRTCLASLRNPGNWKLYVLSLGLEELASSSVPLAASSPAQIEGANPHVLRWTEIVALKKSLSVMQYLVSTSRPTDISDQTAWTQAPCKSRVLLQLTELADFWDALALSSPRILEGAPIYKQQICLEVPAMPGLHVQQWSLLWVVLRVTPPQTNTNQEIWWIIK